MQRHKITISLSPSDHSFLVQKATEKDMEVKELIQSIVQTYILTSKNYPMVEMLAKGLFFKIKQALKPKQVQVAVLV